MIAHLTHSAAHNAGHGSSVIVIVLALVATVAFVAWYARRK